MLQTHIRIPNSQYLVPYADIDRSGSRIFNTSIRELLFNDIGDEPPILGRYFLTAAYLVVDLDYNTFTLWQANPTQDSKLVSVANRATESQCGNETSAPVSDGAPSDPPVIPPYEASRLAAGSITGIAVEATAALSILVLGVFLYLRQVRRRKRVTQDEVRAPAMGGETTADQISEAQQPGDGKQHNTLLHEVHG
ncbi:hypothetical protein Hte_009814 [Hypoxylon texense]